VAVVVVVVCANHNNHRLNDNMSVRGEIKLKLPSALIEKDQEPIPLKNFHLKKDLISLSNSNII
jgi:hypothetical protein